MMIWPNSKMTTLYFDKDAADERHPCVVKISDDTIIVEYDDEGIVQYTGASNDLRHFELTAPSVNGRATLHGFPNSARLEGSWIEDGVRGMWFIELVT